MAEFDPCCRACSNWLPVNGDRETASEGLCSAPNYVQVVNYGNQRFAVSSDLQSTQGESYCSSQGPDGELQFTTHLSRGNLQFISRS